MSVQCTNRQITKRNLTLSNNLKASATSEFILADNFRVLCLTPKAALVLRPALPKELLEDVVDILAAVKAIAMLFNSRLTSYVTQFAVFTKKKDSICFRIRQ